MARGGVREVLLVSRRGRLAEGAAELEGELVGLGARVRIEACDVSDRGELEALVGSVGDRLGIVVHAAGVLDDGVVESLTAERVEGVLAAKVEGAWYLHELTRDLGVREFVLFSSAAGVLGSAGQGAYAAGNAFLDGLASFRRAQGLAGTSVAWGLWAAENGMGDRLDEGQLGRLARSGAVALGVGEGLQLFDAARVSSRALLVGARLDMRALAAAGDAGAAEVRGLLGGLLGGRRRRRVGVGVSFAQRLDGVGERERGRVVLELVRAEAAGVLGHSSVAEVHAERAFKELGFDSLAAVELRNRLEAASGLRLPATVVFDHPSPAALAEHLLGLTGGVSRGVALARRVAVEEPVAVVGMSCRYPGGVRSPEGLWELVSCGGDGISRFPADRGWDLDGLYDPDPDTPGTSYAREGGFVDGAGEFDAAFFGIGPREALAMDPQQRLLLEVCWEALEDAGLDPLGLRGSETGVFAGVMYHDYATGLGPQALAGLEGYLGTGSAGSVVSGRVAYALGLEGPAVSVDTACSSSLVALHWASHALRSGECSLALAGGVTVLWTPGVFVEFSRQRGLAADGRCKSFADAADGTGWSEGVGVLLLERLSDAQRNNHRILGVVRGSAVNQDGASNGLTAPNGPSQERVISQTLASAGLTPGEIDAVEGHGTGTALGDPIEAQALLATYGRDREDRPLWLGSVKSNIGHTQAAAGVAGVIKMLMALKHGVLPRTINVDRPTRHVDWDTGAVQLLTHEVPWQPTNRPRRAGVSSFGISGTNAHVILEEAPPPQRTPPAARPPAREDSTVAEGVPPTEAGRGPTETGSGPAGAPGLSAECVLAAEALPWVVSGRGVGALRAQAGRLGEFVEGDPQLDLVDVAHSLVASRSRFTHRGVVLGGDRAGLLGGLGALSRGEAAGNVFEGVVGGQTGLAYLFTGQGAQRAGMGSALHGTFPVFARALDGVCEEMDAHLEHPLREVLWAREGSQAGLLDRTEFTQVALFALEVASFRLLESFGLAPDFLMGHSIGELAAAHVAGVFSLADACVLVAARGRLMGALPAGGAMVAVQASEQEALGELSGREHAVALAAVNGPRSVVLSGDEQEVLEVAGGFARQGRKTRRLRVSHAFHSPRMEGVLEELGELAAGLSFSAPRIPIVSNVSGESLSAGQACSPGYWVEHVRRTVRFADGVRLLVERGVGSFVEVGPDGVLSALGQECLIESHGASGDLDGESRAGGESQAGGGSQAEGTPQAPLFVPVLRRERTETESLLGALARLYVGGVDVDFGSLFADRPARLVELPRYAFQRERYWLAPRAPGAGDAGATGLNAAEHPLLGAAVGLADSGGWLFTGRLSLQSHPWLADHAVMGAVLLPGTAFVELALHAGRQVGCELLRELTLEEPLVLGEQGEVQVQLTVGEPDEAGCRSFHFHSRAAGNPLDGGESWTRNAGGVLARGESESPDGLGLNGSRASGVPDGRGALDGEAWPPAGAAEVPLEDLYERLAAGGFDYGPAFQCLRAVWRRGEDLFAEVSLSEEQRAQGELFDLHPALLDAALHALAASPSGEPDASPRGPRLPFSWNEVTLGAVGASVLRVRLSAAGDGGVSLRAVDGAGADVLSARSLAMRPVSAEQLGGMRDARRQVLHIDWVPVSGRTPAAVERVVLRGARGGGAAAAHTCAREALKLVQEWLADQRTADARLAIVTCGAVSAGVHEDVSDLGAAAAWGLVRSAQSEHPGRLVLIDVDDTPASWEAVESAAGCGEPQVAIRAGALLAPRLAVAGSTEALSVPKDTVQWRLGAGGANTLDDLALRACPEVGGPLEPGQVRVAVRAAGVNFRDVLIALGVYPEAASVGGEGAGVVLEVGPGVDDLRPGDRVVGMLHGSFGPVAVGDRRLLARMPQGWSFAEAASVPIAFLTAYYALVDLAELREGERLLVHAATGAVGWAAVQLAQHLGAEVFATASPTKWSVLEGVGLGAEHIASSRTPEFRERFLEATEGRGVDVVLDCLAHELVDASLELLPHGGRFIEMGKTDVRDPAEVADRHEGVTYRAFDVVDAGPQRIQEMLGELLALFERGALALPPVKGWDVRRARDAFRFMSQARHVGKNVLTVPPGPEQWRGTALITGATGGLGAVLARHLVAEHGVRSLLLVSRTGPQAPGAGELAQELEGLGAEVRLRACDITDREQLRALLAEVPREQPLSVVVHAAAVLDDGLLDVLSEERLERVLAPKVDGAWHLHELTRELDLRAFVLFSSVASTFGSPGQANYAAANAFLDALAVHRRAQGLPAVSMAWGPWAQETSMTGQLAEGDLARMARAGIGALSSEQGLELFDRACEQDEALVLPLRLDRAALRVRASAGELPALLQGLIRVPARRAAGGPDRSLAQRLAGAPEAERERVVLELVRSQTAAVLNHAGPAAVGARRAFKELGFDSLAAVELRNRLAAATGLQLAATVVFDHPTPVALSEHIVSRVAAGGTAARPASAELAGLERALSAGPVSDAERLAITVRLQALLSGLAELDGVPEPTAEEESLDSATDEEVFELIDSELSEAESSDASSASEREEERVDG